MGSRTDDTFVTGFLRERISGLSLTVTGSNSSKPVPWDLASHSVWDLASHCPIVSGIRNIFFNDVVLKKGSPDYPYVNGYKFAVCYFLERTAGKMEEFLPSLSPVLDPVWWVCARK